LDRVIHRPTNTDGELGSKRADEAIHQDNQHNTDLLSPVNDPNEVNYTAPQNIEGQDAWVATFSRDDEGTKAWAAAQREKAASPGVKMMIATFCLSDGQVRGVRVEAFYRDTCPGCRRPFHDVSCCPGSRAEKEH